MAVRHGEGGTREETAVLFDRDGTITRPWFDFAKVRAEIGIPEPLLENLPALPQGPQRKRGFAILERTEREASASSELNDGADEIVEWLRSRGIRSGLVTRNSRASAETVLEKRGPRFDAVRDAGTRTALLPNGTIPKFLPEIAAEYVIERLRDLRGLIG